MQGGFGTTGRPVFQVPRSPVVGSQRIRPIAVAVEHLSQIGTTQFSVLTKIEPVATANIGGGGKAYLHRPLRIVQAWVIDPR